MITDICLKNQSVALDLLEKIEPDKPQNLNHYLKAAWNIDHALLYQWVSEITQNKSIKNWGAVFVRKYTDYLNKRRAK
ncbi:MAG: hypothetical protein AAB546_00140 [Patescibacteria group bacterium]